MFFNEGQLITLRGKGRRLCVGLEHYLVGGQIYHYKRIARAGGQVESGDDATVS